MMLPFLGGRLRTFKPPVIPGSANYTTPGSYSFTVPNFNTLTVDVRGAGGESCGNFYGGANGGYSSFNGSVVGLGGAGGIWDAETSASIDGAHGGAYGGDTNILGGGAAGGVLGGYRDGGDPDGGNGGRAVKTYADGALTPGASVTVVVGAAGSNSASWPDGGHGAVYISWS